MILCSYRNICGCWFSLQLWSFVLFKKLLQTCKKTSQIQKTYKNKVCIANKIDGTRMNKTFWGGEGGGGRASRPAERRRTGPPVVPAMPRRRLLPPTGQRPPEMKGRGGVVVGWRGRERAASPRLVGGSGGGEGDHAPGIASPAALARRRWTGRLLSGAAARCQGRNGGVGRAKRSGAEQPCGVEQSRQKNASSLHLLETSPFWGSAKHCTCEAKVDLPLKSDSPCWTQSN
jgi:hypothetical protein